METGTVKLFYNERGFGFVRPDDGGHDIFVHVSQVMWQGYPEKGQRVRYTSVVKVKGFEAQNVHLLEE